MQLNPAGNRRVSFLLRAGRVGVGQRRIAMRLKADILLEKRGLTGS